MIQPQTGPFANAENFAANLMKMIMFNSAVVELVQWMDDVEAGMKDPELPPEVKAQVIVDYNEIQKHFNQFTGSVPQN
jgi:hypothetical protein